MQVYKHINNPLRDPDCSLHPLPVTTKLLSEAIAKLRVATKDASRKHSSSRCDGHGGGVSAAGVPAQSCSLPVAASNPSTPTGRRRRSSLLPVRLSFQPSMKQHSVEMTESRKRSESAYWSLNLWRGMADVRPTDDFLRRGGTEASPLSSTSDPLIALKYAIRNSKTGHSILLKLETDNFMTRGVDLSFVSAFPAESEYL